MMGVCARAGELFTCKHTIALFSQEVFYPLLVFQLSAFTNNT